MEKAIYECHGHIMMNGLDYPSAAATHRNGADEASVRKALEELKDAGVTHFRDGGDAFGVWKTARELAPEYGITYLTPCFAIHKKGRYGSIVGKGYDTFREYMDLLRELCDLGADFVKLMLSGIITFDELGKTSCEPLDFREMRLLIDAAHSGGFSVMVHVNGAKAVKNALEAGADSIEHGYFMDDDCIALLAETGAVWVPTLAAVEAFVGRPGFDRNIVTQTLMDQRVNVFKAHAAGALVASGSDSGAAGVPHGCGIMRELQLLGGIDADKANRAVFERFSAEKI